MTRNPGRRIGDNPTPGGNPAGQPLAFRPLAMSGERWRVYAVSVTDPGWRHPGEWWLVRIELDGKTVSATGPLTTDEAAEYVARMAPRCVGLIGAREAAAAMTGT